MSSLVSLFLRVSLSPVVSTRLSSPSTTTHSTNGPDQSRMSGRHRAAAAAAVAGFIVFLLALLSLLLSKSVSRFIVFCYLINELL